MIPAAPFQRNNNLRRQQELKYLYELFHDIRDFFQFMSLGIAEYFERQSSAIVNARTALRQRMIQWQYNGELLLVFQLFYCTGLFIRSNETVNEPNIIKLPLPSYLRLEGSFRQEIQRKPLLLET
jgi:hypothetical protein